MMKFSFKHGSRLLMLAIPLAASLPHGAFAADILGEPVRYTARSGIDGTIVAGGSTFVIPNGVTFQFNNLAFGAGVLGTSGTFTFRDLTGQSAPAQALGGQLDFTRSGFPGLSAVNLIQTNIGGFDPSRIRFDSDSLYIEVGGLTLTNDTFVSLAISAVPEVSSLAAMLAGIAGVTLTARRRNTQARAAARALVRVRT